MLAVSADPVFDPTTLLYQRLSVIVADLVFFAGVRRYEVRPCGTGRRAIPYSHTSAGPLTERRMLQAQPNTPGRTLVAAIALMHAGLFIVDRTPVRLREEREPLGRSRRRALFHGCARQTFTFSTTASCLASCCWRWPRRGWSVPGFQIRPRAPPAPLLTSLAGANRWAR